MIGQSSSNPLQQAVKMRECTELIDFLLRYPHKHEHISAHNATQIVIR